MLRIMVDEPTNGIATLRTEGKLIGPWVEELRRACARALVGGARLALDLSQASFIDAQGIALVRRLHARGVTIVACSGLVAEQLKGGGIPC